MLLSYDTKKEEEKNQIFAMYQEIFQDPELFAQYYFDMVYPDNRVLMAKKDGDLCAMVHLNPYSVMFCNEKIDVCYVVAVATKKEMRRQGLMAALLNQSFQDMYEEGRLFTYLIPAREEYYTPFDFRFVMDWESCRFCYEKSDLERKSNMELSDDKIVRLEQKDYKEGAALLNEWRGKNFSLFVRADEFYMRRQDEEMKSEKGGLFYLVHGEKKAGMFFATMDEDSLSLTNVWLPERMTKEKFADLLFDTFHKNKIEITFPGSKAGWVVEKSPEIMVRVICLISLLEKITGKKENQICLFVEDSILPQNEGCYLWQLGTSKSCITKTDQDPQWTVKIGDLTEIIFGYGNWKKRYEKAPEDVKEFFEQLLPICEISITEQV